MPLWFLFYQKPPRHALNQAFWKWQHQKTRCGINNKLLLQENCRSNLKLNCLMSWWVASTYAIISKCCLGVLKVQPGTVAGGALCSSGLLHVQTRAAGSVLTLQEGCQKSHVRCGRPCYVVRSHGLCGHQIFLFFAVGRCFLDLGW